MKLPIDFQNFAGGFCSRPMQDNEAAEMLDCYVRRDGVLVGTIPFQEVDNDLGGVPVAFFDSEAGTFCIATSGIFKRVSGSWTSIATPSPAATTAYLGSITQFDSTLLFAHKSWSDLYKYDGTTCEAIKAEQTYAELSNDDPIVVAAMEEEWRKAWNEFTGAGGIDVGVGLYTGYDGPGSYWRNKPFPGAAEAQKIIISVWGGRAYSWVRSRINQRKHSTSFSPDLVAVDSQFCYATNDNKIFYTPDPSTWNPNIYLIPEGDDRILEMLNMFGRLFLFKRSGIYCKTSGEEESWSLEKVCNEPCCSRVAVSPQGVYYLGPDSLMRFDGSRSVKVSAKLDPSVLKASICEPRVFYSSRTNQVYIPASDGYLYVWDELMDRWHRRSYADVVCMREAMYEPAGKTSEFTLGYNGIYRCNITKSGNYLSSEVGGAADPVFTLPAVVDGGVEGRVDLTDAAVATYQDLADWINALGDYTATIVSDATTASVNLEDTPGMGITDRANTFRSSGGATSSFMRMSLFSSHRVYEEDTSTGQGGDGVLTTRVLDFGSPELYKRPYRLYLDGTVANAVLYSDRGVTYEDNHYPPERVNYYAPTGEVKFNFTLALTGITELRSMRLVVDGVAV